MNLNDLVDPRTGKPYTALDYTAYPIQWTNQAPQTVGNQASQQIDNDSDFIVTKMMYWASVATATYSANPGLKFMLQDGGSNKPLYKQPMFLENCAGTGQLPFVLPIPRRFSANTSIVGILYNPTTLTFDYVEVELHGIRCYL